MLSATSRCPRTGLTPLRSRSWTSGCPAGFVDRLERRRYGDVLAVHFASRLDQIHFKLYALVDQGSGKHEQDLRALRPTASELLQAAQWARTHDPSGGFPARTHECSRVPRGERCRSRPFLQARAQEVEAEVAAFDVDEEAAMRLAALRGAIAGEVTGADGLGAVRSALKRVFKKITLVRTPEDELVLVPEVCAFEEVDAWVRLPDGRSAVKPKPQTLALPQKQRVREPLSSNPLFAAALFAPIPLGASSA